MTYIVVTFSAADTYASKAMMVSIVFTWYHPTINHWNLFDVQNTTSKTKLGISMDSDGLLLEIFKVFPNQPPLHSLVHLWILNIVHNSIFLRRARSVMYVYQEVYCIAQLLFSAYYIANYCLILLLLAGQCIIVSIYLLIVKSLK